MIIYATDAQLTAWLACAPPSDAALYLRSASIVVAKAGNRDPYNDSPSTLEAAVLADATCAQVQSWLALGIKPWALGLDVSLVKKSAILGADVERDTTGRAAGLQCAASDIAPEARAILLQAGLLWLDVPLGDPAPYLPDYGLSGAHGWLVEGVCGEYAGGWPFI